jgi:cold shock protein
MTTGTVKFFNETKGFGFIKNDEDENDQTFVHVSALNGVKIKEGDKVEYDKVDSDKGEGKKNAVNIRLI